MRRVSRRRRGYTEQFGEALLISDDLHSNPGFDNILGGSPRGHVELSALSRYIPPTPITAQEIGRDELAHSSNMTCQQENSGVHVPFASFPEYHQYSSVDPSQKGPVSKCIIPVVSHGCLCCPCVRTQELGIVEQCGRFETIVGPGLHLQPWPWTGITRRLDLSIQECKIQMECNTLDRVFCHLQFILQYRLSTPRAYEAYYRIQNINSILSSLLIDRVRTLVPGIGLDDLFRDSRSKLTNPIFRHLFGRAMEYGYELCHVLLTNIQPNEMVRESMNEIKSCEKLKVAASYQAETNKLQVIKTAEANAEALYLHGVGTARQRKALQEQWLEQSVHQWVHDVYIAPDKLPTNQEIMTLLLLTQYFDTITHLSVKSGTDGSTASQLFMSHTDWFQSMRSPTRSSGREKTRKEYGAASALLTLLDWPT